MLHMTLVANLKNAVIERGFRHREPVDEDWGRLESYDPNNPGDIADEGAGHRG
jgi:hypothetical protein